YKEPMCDCLEWHLIFAGTPEATPPGSGPSLLTPRPGITPGLGSPNNRPPSTYTGLFSATPPPGAGAAGSSAQQPTPEFPSPFGTPTTQTVGPIIAVRSSVHKRGFRKWRDLEYYDEWRFIAGDADSDTGRRTFIPGAPPPPGQQPGLQPTAGFLAAEAPAPARHARSRIRPSLGQRTPKPKPRVIRHVLDGGLTVVVDEMRDVRSLAVGVYVEAGSEGEPASRGGLSHFLEHVLFKRTRRRSNVEIARV